MRSTSPTIGADRPTKGRLLQAFPRGSRKLSSVRAELSSGAKERDEGFASTNIVGEDGRPGGRALDDAGAGNERLLDDPLEECPQSGSDLLRPGRVGLGSQRLADPAFGLDDGGVEEIEEGLLLAPEVLVKGFEADPGALDDQLDGHVVVAALGDQLARGTQDALALGALEAASGDRRWLGQRCP